jgi:hypothetical protein
MLDLAERRAEVAAREANIVAVRRSVFDKSYVGGRGGRGGGGAAARGRLRATSKHDATPVHAHSNKPQPIANLGHW